MTKNFKIAIAVCLISAITFFTFLPVLQNDFTNWDDWVYVTENPIIKDLSFGNLKQIFCSLIFANYHPLTVLSYALEYHFFQLNPFAFHLTSLILHLLNCLLVFWLFYIFSREIFISFLTALLFGVHPLGVETVAWVSARKDLLYSVFFLGSLICYCYYLKNNRLKKYYYFCLFLFVLSLLSKAMAISLPLILLLFDYNSHGRINKAALKEKIPFFILSVIFGIIGVLGQHSIGAIRNVGVFNFPQKFLVANYTIIFYLNKIFIPLGLACAYPYSQVINYSSGQVSWYLYFFVAILFVSVFLTAKYTKKIIFGSAFFLIVIFPALQFVPIGAAAVADRYVYLAAVGVFYLFSEGFLWLYKIRSRFNGIVKALLLILLVLIIAALTTLSRQRCRVWKDSMSLWSDAIKNYPTTAIAYNNRGTIYLDNKEYEKAYLDFIKAITFDRRFYEAYLNLGKLYRVQGNYGKAIEFYRKAINIEPDKSEVYEILVDLYDKTGSHNEVINLSNKILKIKPGYAKGYSNLCGAYGRAGDYRGAIEACQNAITLEPDLAEAHNNISVAYYYTKQYDLSVKHRDRAIELGFTVNPDFMKLLEPLKKKIK